MAKKGSFFERMGLVEKVPSEDEGYEAAEMRSDYTPGEYADEDEVDAEAAELTDTETFISDIYAQYSMSDLSKSIFKAEDVMKTLPMEMATDTKRNTVIGILSSFNLTATDVTEDGEERIKTLNAVNKKTKEENLSEIDVRLQKIEDLKGQIEELNKEVSALKDTTASAEALISAEVDKIQSLIDFLTGVK